MPQATEQVFPVRGVFTCSSENIILSLICEKNVLWSNIIFLHTINERSLSSTVVVTVYEPQDKFTSQKNMMFMHKYVRVILEASSRDVISCIHVCFS